MPEPGSIQKLKRYWLLIIFPIVVAVCFIIAIRMDKSMQAARNDRDFLPFWLAGRMIVNGENPYDAGQWSAGYSQYENSLLVNPAFLYPLPLAQAFAPLGLLPMRNAYIVWVTISELMILASLSSLLLMDKSEHAKLIFVPILAGLALFRPTILTLTQGQVSVLFLFGLTGIALSWQRQRWFLGGLLLGLLALKPNLGAPLIALLAAWLLLNQHWRALLGTLVSGIVLLIAGLIYDPAWVAQYWHVGGNKLAGTFGGSPTVWGLGALISHNNLTTTLLIGGFGALIILIGFFRVILLPHTTMSPLSILSLAVCVTLLVTPYTWTYDQLLLLLPVVAVTLGLDRMGVRFPLTVAILPGLDILVIILLVFDAILQVEILNVIIPAAMLGMCLWRNSCLLTHLNWNATLPNTSSK